MLKAQLMRKTAEPRALIPVNSYVSEHYPMNGNNNGPIERAGATSHSAWKVQISRSTIALSCAAKNKLSIGSR